MFKSEHFKKQAGLLTFIPSIYEWTEKTNIIGFYVKSERYGGIYRTNRNTEILKKI